MSERKSGIELLRILSMMSVIGHHFLKYGGVLDASTFGSSEYIIYWLINGLFFTCVNCFMLITGYFMSKSEMKASRLFKFWLQVLFYSVICTVIITILTKNRSIVTLVKAFAPLTTEQYWFATHYALILCFIPLLNVLVANLSKRQFHLGLLILFVVMSVMPTFLVWERDLMTSGRDYPWMIVLYLTGAYMQRYGLRLNKKKSYMLFAICVLVTGLMRTPLGLISLKLVGSEVLAGLFFRYNSVTVYLGAVFLFNGMLQIEKIKHDKVILKIAPLSFAVYLIHDNPNVRPVLWEHMPMEQIIQAGIPVTICILVSTILGIFLLGCGIEKIRLEIFRCCRIDSLYVYADKIASRIDSLLAKHK